MAQLDKSRPFGEVIGHRFQRYEQDYKAFNGAGEECDENGVVVEDEAPLVPAPIPEPEQKPAETLPTDPEATTTGSEPKESEPDEVTTVEASMKHRGGGYYKVFDTKGDLVGEDFKKAEAEAKVIELQQNADQISKALGDG